MKHTKKKNYSHLYGWGVMLLILIIILFTTVGCDSNNENAINESVVNDVQNDMNQENTNSVDVQEDTEVVDNSKEITIDEASKEESNDEPSNEAQTPEGKLELKKWYSLNQGNIYKVDGKKVVVGQVGRDAAKLTIDGTDILIGLEDLVVLDDFCIKSEDSIFFTAEDDTMNMISLKFGCSDSDTIEYYVNKKGENKCENIIEFCQDQFGIDHDDDLRCHERIVNQGEKFAINKVDMEVIQISKNAVKILVDGDMEVIDYENILKRPIRINLRKSGVLYTNAGSKNNMAVLKFGCASDETYKDDYVLTEGNKICLQMQKTCEEEFDFEFEDD